MIRSFKVFAVKAVFLVFMALSCWLVLCGIFSYALDLIKSLVNINPLAEVLSFFVLAYLVGLFFKTRKLSSNRQSARFDTITKCEAPLDVNISFKTNVFATLCVAVWCLSVVTGGFVVVYLFYGVAGLVGFSAVFILILTVAVFRSIPDESPSVVIEV